MPNNSSPDHSDPDAKVLFRVPYEDDSDEAEVETLWAWDLGNDRYKIDNLPYFAYSVSCGDIVLAPFSEEEGFPTFSKVLEKSGNKTVRIIFETPVETGNESQQILDYLVELGCDYEGSNRRYIVVNIPPHTNFDAVVDFLTRNEVQFEHTDPTYLDLYGDE